MLVSVLLFMILIINVCDNIMHYFEFVKPVEDILRKKNIDFSTMHHSQADKDVIIDDKFKKIIICGTSLRDFGYSKSDSMNYSKNASDSPKNFSWIKDIKKPLLGICAGMQIIGQAFNCMTEENLEIGLIDAKFSGFLGINGIKKVYSLHNLALKNDAVLVKTFDILAVSEKTDTVQAIRHKSRPIYGVLFHPEVRNKDIIEKFLIH